MSALGFVDALPSSSVKLDFGKKERSEAFSPGLLELAPEPDFQHRMDFHMQTGVPAKPLLSLTPH